MSNAPASDVGVPLGALRNLGLSATVRGLLDHAMDLKAKHDFRGPLDTGTLFFALVDAGANSKREFFGPAVFARMMRQWGGGSLDELRERFFAGRADQPDPPEPIATREVYEAFENASQLPRHDGIIAARHLIVSLLAMTPPQAPRQFQALVRNLSLEPADLLKAFVESLAARGEEKEREGWKEYLARLNRPKPRTGLGSDEASGRIRQLRAEVARHIFLYHQLKKPEITDSAYDMLKASLAELERAHPGLAPVGSQDVAATSAPTRVVPVPAGPRFSGYQADVPSGRAADDCLNLDATVAAFANLLASPQLTGNLSLGVFGNWGSGKSFFMERLLVAIDELTASARDAEAHRHADDESATEAPYWSNIAQIRFNAWHYADANLWASLMSHLLAELQRWDPNPRRAGVLSPLQNALGQLEISAAAQADAKKRQETASAAVKTAEEARDKTQQKCADAAQAVAEVAQRSLWSFLAADFLPKAEVDQLAAEFERVGLAADDARQPIEKVYAELKELSTAGGQVRAVVTGLLRAPDGNRKLLEFAAWIGVPVVLLLLLLLTPAREWLRESAAWFATTLAGFSVAIARAASWIKSHAAGALAALRPLTVARRRIEEALTVAEGAKASEVARKENELAAARAELAAANAEVSERNRELEKATEAVAEAVSGRAVSRFIERRLASGDYQKHLGLVALIRRDFEQLSELIRAHNAQRRSLPEERKSAIEALLKARPALTPAELEGIFANLGVNRIILYIDDLDRCPAERVVQVLEAIHLLLAFPIFVVVVGVDARWMHHALATQFPALLGRTKTAANAAGGNGGEPETGLRDVTPSDYLEKIFQIPFWVPPLDGAATKTMLARLTQDLRVLPADPSSLAGRGGKPAGAAPPKPGSSPTAKAEPGADPAAADAVRRQSGTGGLGGPGAAATALAAAGGKEKAAESNVARRPEALRLSDAELADMQTLAPVIGRSPRATKRFVNSYRLLKASLTPKETAALAAGDAGAGRAPMFLLAVVTGLPELAPKLFATMAWSRGGKNPFALLADFARAGGIEIETVRRLEELESDPKAMCWREVTHEQLAPWTGRVAQFAFEDLLPTTPAPSAARASAAPNPA